MAIATTSHFYIYDTDQNLKFIFSGYRNGSIRQADDFHLYVIADTVHQLKVKDMSTGNEMVKDTFEPPGCYILDVNNIFRGTFSESYKLQSALVGTNIDLSFSNFAQKMVFMKTMQRAMVLPYVHRNTVNLNGVSQKSDYLIWREKGGFFTAMNKEGVVQTWSLATGNKLYNVTLPSFSHIFRDFNIYCANSDDKSYHSSYFNFKHSSLSLVMSNQPLTQFIKQGTRKVYEKQLTGGLKVSTHLQGK